MAEQDFGRYRLIEVLGEGAMGVVYRALDPRIERTVAIKTFKLEGNLAGDELEEFHERFRREAMTAGRLSHPGIVTVFDFGHHEGIPYIAMELIEGEALRDRVEREGPPPLEEAVRIIVQVARALDYAHQEGIIHRDVTPENIMITRDGRAKITDFGIARLESASQLTRPGIVLGTPAFMSPEQVAGRAIDGRSDIFSLGVIAYWLLTGRLPFQGETVLTVVYHIVHSDPPPLSDRDPRFKGVVEDVVYRALAKNPDERFQRAGEFADALVRALRQVLAPPPVEATMATMELPRVVRPASFGAPPLPPTPTQEVGPAAPVGGVGGPPSPPPPPPGGDDTSGSGGGGSGAGPPAPLPGGEGPPPRVGLSGLQIFLLITAAALVLAALGVGLWNLVGADGEVPGPVPTASPGANATDVGRHGATGGATPSPGPTFALVVGSPTQTPTVTPTATPHLTPALAPSPTATPHSAGPLVAAPSPTPRPPSRRLRALRAWSQSQTGIEAPLAVAVAADGRLALLDSSREGITLLSRRGAPLAILDRKADTSLRLDDPVDLTFGPDNNIYVVDQGDTKVWKVSPQGRVLWTYEASGDDDKGLEEPQGIAFNPRSDELFITDSDLDKVLVLDRRGRFRRTFRGPAEGGEELDDPIGIAVGPRGWVYVVDGTGMVRIFDHSGTHLRDLTPRLTPKAARLVDVALLDGEHLVLADRRRHRVSIHDARGRVVASLGGRRGRTLGTFDVPLSLGVGPGRVIYVADRDNNRIQLLAYQ